MSVSRNTIPETRDEIAGYADNVQLMHRANLKMDMTNATGADLPATGNTEGIWWRELAAGAQFAEQTQVAELTKIEHWFSSVYIKEEGSAGTTPGYVWVECQVDTPDALQFGGASTGPSSIDNTPDVTFDDTSPPTEADFKTALSTTSDGENYFAETRAEHQPAFNDTPNSTGGGGSPATVDYFEVNFREDWGMGPLFTAEQRINASGVWQWYQVENQEIHYKTVWKTYWDIWELESPLNEIPSLRDI